LAFFGAPVAREDDTTRAVACALAMQNAMTAVNKLNEAQGLPAIAMRVVVSTGDVVVGNIGSERRSKYAAVGSAINLAARIENHSGAGEVMISDATYLEVAKRITIAETREIEAKGFDGLVPIHLAVSIDVS
jgi:adenylate cyclase